MTDEQIIKALECCATDETDDCFQCPYDNIVYKPGNGGCVNRCRKDALDLINRQKVEIERLLQKLQQARVEAIQLKEIIKNTLSNYRNSKTITYEIPEDVIDVIYCIVLNMIYELSEVKEGKQC